MQFQEIDRVTYSHTFKEANFLADALASVDRYFSSPMFWFGGLFPKRSNDYSSKFFLYGRLKRFFLIIFFS